MDKKHQILRTPQVNADIADSAKTKLKKGLVSLVQKFKEEDGWSKSEEHVQTSFSIKLLELLGWDSSNWNINQGQDVKTGKKPDIVLKSSTSKLLVIESKDAHKKDMLDGSYPPKTFVEQLLKYCSGEGVAWGVLTNFVEWRLYSFYQGRLYKNRKYAFYDLLWPNANKEDYIDLLSEDGLSFLLKLSRSFLLQTQGRIDNDTIYYPVQQDLGVEKIKKEFFEKIKVWRSSLRKYLLKNYPRIEVDDIDLLAQKILDRLIFMDICHDKHVIGEDIIGQVKESKLPKYQELKQKFKQMDDKFNTELFTFKDYSQINEEDIKINDEVILPIITDLIKIDFSKLSVHIIGEVYENYLGELAKSRTTDEKKISDKQKQKRKAQGIYYTPDYIVDYIVKNTIGEILKKAKTVEDIEKIRVLDPACGSGSFLIRAFDEFLSAYMRVHKEGGLFAFELKKKILQKNLFGVDLDAKAVEITKLNLMIKALDGVKAEDLKGRHLLPNLNLNIRFGNSLIGGEQLQMKENTLDLYGDFNAEIDKLSVLKLNFYKETDNNAKADLLEEITKLETVINQNIDKGLSGYINNLDKIKPFNYKVSFCEIFKDGGFDAIIGNPPYLRVQGLVKNDKSLAETYKEFFQSASGSFDIYLLFVEKALGLLNNKGKLGYILPSKFFQGNLGKDLRNIIADKKAIYEVIDFSQFQVFDSASNYTCLLFLDNDNKKKSFRYAKVLNYDDPKLVLDEIMDKTPSNNYEESLINVSSLKNTSWAFQVGAKSEIIEKLKKQPNTLADIVQKIFQGIATSADDIYVLKIVEEKQASVVLYSESLGKNVVIEKGLIKPFLMGKDLHQYQKPEFKHYVIFPYIVEDGKADFMKPKYISEKFPLGWQYLTANKKELENREHGRMKHADFYAYIYPKNLTLFDNKKIMTPEIAYGCQMTFDNEGLYHTTKVYSFVFKEDVKEDKRYLLGIMNSKIFWFFLSNTGYVMRGGYFAFKTDYLKPFPIHLIDFNNKEEKEMHDKIVKLVDEILKLNTTSALREKNKSKIQALDYEIDKLAYELYGLGEEEINIVEGR
ncbi:MAG: hypothetical protein A2Y82_01560 [Candidatus Buchananbacteria bacterium RBG_13_36_9]|uniref:site-specific DNA-methyltransferase (adenine-specific) n=1 Tax=Candidatus Buchananbacteria bacterium RBG_13_36_9 TaxID=1797530 RepID=A0A1G1XLS5_9BACT|nr:MAG: hypothetical protein A2Y82_01560 [Candidatus Buchananbacteria bacterium RBG_13_36_9]